MKPIQKLFKNKKRISYFRMYINFLGISSTLVIIMWYMKFVGSHIFFLFIVGFIFIESLKRFYYEIEWFRRMDFNET